MANAAGSKVAKRSSYSAGADIVLFRGAAEQEVRMMDPLKRLTALAFGAVLLAGCGTDRDESAAQTAPAEEPDPAMSDTLPTAEDPPPTEPSPPPNR